MKKNLVVLLIGFILGLIFGFFVKPANVESNIGEKKTSDKDNFVEVSEEDYVQAEANFVEVSDETVKEDSDDFNEEIRQIFETYSYTGNKKPYIIDEYVDDYWETKVVYDKSKGRAICEDGDEIVNINGTLGLRNLRELSKVENGEEIRIMNELDECIYVVHAGDISEYLDEE